MSTESADAWNSVCSKLIHYCVSKDKSPLLSLSWIDFGKFVITGAQSGEIERWSVNNINHEEVLNAHESAVSAMSRSNDESIIVTGDESGQIKIWSRNLMFQHNLDTHKECVRGIAFAPHNIKLLTCSDDKTAKVTDIETGKEMSVFSKHAAEVKACDWHPYEGVVMTGGKDNFAKLWDPRSAEELCILYAHHQYINRIKWHSNGNWVATGSKDSSVRVHDIRTMKTLEIFQQHKKEVSALAWHPYIEDLLVSGSADNSLVYWNMTEGKMEREILMAHEKEITGAEWHPLGYVLATCSTDNTAKFWARTKCGDTTEMLYNAIKPIV